MVPSFRLPPYLITEAASFFETSAQCTRPHGGTFHRACFCHWAVVTTLSVYGGRLTFSEVPVSLGNVTWSFGAADLTCRRRGRRQGDTDCCTQLLVTTCTNLSPHHSSYFFLVLLLAASRFLLLSSFISLSFFSASRTSFRYCCSLCGMCSENADCGLLTCDLVRSGRATYHCL